MGLKLIFLIVSRAVSLLGGWVGSCRRELLDRTLVWNQRHLMIVLRGYENFCNTRRPHRALKQAAPPRQLPDGITDLDQFRVQRRDRAGGMIHEYRLVAWVSAPTTGGCRASWSGSATRSPPPPSGRSSLVWWSIAFMVIYGLCLWLLLHMVPPPSPMLSAAQVAEFYARHHTSIRVGAVTSSYTGAFLVPISIVIAVQLSRLEKGRPIWSMLSLAGGLLMSIFLVLPPVFWEPRRSRRLARPR